MHAQVGFDFGAESAFAKATVDTDISDKAAVASATWFQRGAPACEGSRVAGLRASMLSKQWADLAVGAQAAWGGAAGAACREIG